MQNIGENASATCKRIAGTGHWQTVRMQTPSIACFILWRKQPP